MQKLCEPIRPTGPEMQTHKAFRSFFSVMQPRRVPVKQSPAVLHQWIHVRSPFSMVGCKTELENPTALTSLISVAGKIFCNWVARCFSRSQSSWLRSLILMTLAFGNLYRMLLCRLERESTFVDGLPSRSCSGCLHHGASLARAGS